MEICDFCAATNIIYSCISEGAALSQPEFIVNLFKHFTDSDFGKTFSYDNARINRWLHGTEKVSPLIINYYSTDGCIEYMAIDIEASILPILYDTDKAVSQMHELVSNDTTISEHKKHEIIGLFPYENDTEVSDFFSRAILFGMERTFIKRDSKFNAVIAAGNLSPTVKDYVFSAPVPKPCKHFCGRESEISELHTLLNTNSKVFIQGIAGIGKSEFVKKYANMYRNEYTNILYFNYSSSLKRMIAECEFADDMISDTEDVHFKRHNRFLRSLKEDTLIIIDNFNIAASDDEIFDVIMKYRCRIVFTTRSCFDDHCYYELNELNDASLINLFEYFYPETDENIECIKMILDEIHRHTFSAELSARLLSFGIMDADKLLAELKKTKSILHTDDRVRTYKDGISSKATYHEHIHMLLSLFGLSEQKLYIMRNMIFIPNEGIRPKLFANWIERSNLNDINDLVEYGFICRNGFMQITLHPLIREIAIDDTAPSIDKCAVLVNALRELCLNHGLDYNYHRVMFHTIENIILLADKDDEQTYLLFLKDTFPYMEKYAYGHGMETVIAELERIGGGAEEQALLLDYKAAYEHVCRQDYKRSLAYEKDAARLCDKIEAANPRLAANIYSNLGGLYHLAEDMENARAYMEKAYNVVINNRLSITNDTVIQLCNYANLATNIGDTMRALEILEACAIAVKKFNSDMSSDYANLIWSMGNIYMQAGEFAAAAKKYKEAISIYTVVWADEPERIKEKEQELREIVSLYNFVSPRVLLT